MLLILLKILIEFDNFLLLLLIIELFEEKFFINFLLREKFGVKKLFSFDEVEICEFKLLKSELKLLKLLLKLLLLLLLKLLKFQIH